MRTQTARSVLLVVAVAALVALAGCSGGDDGTTTAPDDMTDAPTEEMTTTAGETGMTTTESGSGMETTTEAAGETTTEAAGETTTEAAGETTTEEPSDGNTGDGVSSESIFSEHADAVEAAGSFTANVQIQVTSSQQNLTANTVTYANVDTGNGYQRSSLESSFFSQTTEVYTQGDETWQRTNNSFQGVQYNYSSAPYDGAVQPVNTSQAASGNFQFGDTELTWSQAGSETVNGIQTTRYTANDISSPERVSSLIGSNVTSVDNIQFEAYVDEDGIVRRLSLDFSGETSRTGQVQQTLTYELTDIGSTTVPTPDWLDEARQQTGS